MTDGQEQEQEQQVAGAGRVNLGPAGSVDLTNPFTYHRPTEDQIPKYEQIRKGGLDMATLISMNCPPGPERSTAIAKVREAVMWANAGIACSPPPSQD